MKQLQQLCATFVLVLAFTASAFADGIIHGDKTPPPPPTSSTVSMIHGDIVSTDQELESEDTTVDLTMEIALSLIQNMLALF